MNELYLVHHGIKGQKWGVRRQEAKAAVAANPWMGAYAATVVSAGFNYGRMGKGIYNMARNR